LKLTKVSYTNEGLEAIVFTAEGDMRQAVNNLQSTHSGFGFISPINVYKVCDQPHPVQMQEIVKACITKDVDSALDRLQHIWKQGYAPVDIVNTFFKVTKQMEMSEGMKLHFIKEIGFTHMRVLEGLNSFLQVSRLIATLCEE
jgi:replication factor C subunit 2/4